MGSKKRQWLKRKPPTSQIQPTLGDIVASLEASVGCGSQLHNLVMRPLQCTTPRLQLPCYDAHATCRMQASTQVYTFFDAHPAGEDLDLQSSWSYWAAACSHERRLFMVRSAVQCLKYSVVSLLHYALPQVGVILAVLVAGERAKRR